jgi:hypothetical protein
MSAPLHPIKRYEYYARRAANYRAARTRRFWSRIVSFFVFIVVILAVAAWSEHGRAVMQADPAVQKIEQSVYYPNCAAARAAGAAPINEGQPGYRAELDGDDDGIACEPWPR